MLIINSREFRQNQKIYFDLADKNEQIIVHRGKNKAYKIVPVDRNDKLMTESEFISKIELSAMQAINGDTAVLTKEMQVELIEK